MQQCPSLRKKIADHMTTPEPAKFYKTEIAAIDCRPAHVRVMKPRNIKQVNCKERIIKFSIIAA